jgi:transcriptional regulator with XRE-family HTH domain
MILQLWLHTRQLSCNSSTVNVFSVSFKQKISFFGILELPSCPQASFVLMLGGMGYADKLQRLCALRGLDQAALASKVGLSKSSISRIMSGTQEPKLRLAYDLAKALGVTLDYLVSDSPELGPNEHMVMVTEDELMILKIVRRLGYSVAIDRLLNVPSPPSGVEAKGSAPASGSRNRTESERLDPHHENLPGS